MAEAKPKNLLQQICSTIWWLVLLRGLAVFLLGLLLLFWPVGTILLIVQFIGAFWLVDGIITLIQSIRGRKFLKNWGWGVFVGILGIFAGLVVFARPLLSALLSATFMISLVAIISLFSGIWSIATGIRLRKEIDNEWSMILGGTVYVLFGLLLLGNPVMTAAVLVWITGICAFIGGIFLIVLSFRIRAVGCGEIIEIAEEPKPDTGPETDTEVASDTDVTSDSDTKT